MLRWRSAVTASVLMSLFVLAGCGGSGSTSDSSSGTSAVTALVAPTTSSTTSSPTTTLVEITSPTWFSTPSGNISCAVQSEYARCDITVRAWEPPPRPVDCPLDWGPTLAVDLARPGGFRCVSDSVYRPDVVVPYGRLVRNGPMACAVESSGVTCRSEAGHGFFLSAESYRTF